jgi:para-nitrobenzyl esterase
MPTKLVRVMREDDTAKLLTACKGKDFSSLRFNDPDAPQRFFPSLSFPTGAYHAAELQYLFTLTRGTRPVFAPDQVRLSETMVQYWTQFAWAANPNSPPTPDWPRYDTTNQRFQALVPGTSAPATGFATDHKCALFGG